MTCERESLIKQGVIIKIPFVPKFFHKFLLCPQTTPTTTSPLTQTHHPAKPHAHTISHSHTTPSPHRPTPLQPFPHKASSTPTHRRCVTRTVLTQAFPHTKTLGSHKGESSHKAYSPHTVNLHIPLPPLKKKAL